MPVTYEKGIDTYGKGIDTFENNGLVIYEMERYTRTEAWGYS